MHIALYLLTNTVSLMLGVLTFAMLLRMIFSFIPAAEDWKVTEFIYYLTEVAVAPVRGIVTRFSFAESLPIDISYLLTYMIITCLQLTLPVISL